MIERRWTAVAAILVVGTALLAGCGGGEKAAEKAAEKAIEKESGGKADVEIGSGGIRIKTEEGEAEFTSEGATWPDDLPSQVPEFSEGRLMATNRMTQDGKQAWMLAFEDVEGGEFRDFVDQVKKKGWKIGMTTTTEDLEMIQAEKGDLALVATYGGRDGEVSIQVFQEAE